MKVTFQNKEDVMVIEKAKLINKSLTNYLINCKNDSQHLLKTAKWTLVQMETEK